MLLKVVSRCWDEWIFSLYKQRSLQGQIYWKKNTYVCICIFIYLCDVVLITNQRLYFNTGALLGGTDVFTGLSFIYLITGLEQMFLSGGNSVLQICRKWVCACCSVQGLGELVPVSWLGLSIRKDDQGPVFCLLARSDVGAPWLCRRLSAFPWYALTQVRIRGEVSLVLLSRVSWVREAIFTFSPFKKWKREDNDRKRLTLHSSLSLP